MHYPYSRGQSSLLVSGRKTYLAEAYTLDDAPDYEIFIMAVSERPLAADSVLGDVRRIIGGREVNQALIEETVGTVFKDCKTETITILK